MMEACLVLAGVIQKCDVIYGTKPIQVKPSITLRPINNLKTEIASMGGWLSDIESRNV